MQLDHLAIFFTILVTETYSYIHIFVVGKITAHHYPNSRFVNISYSNFLFFLFAMNAQGAILSDNFVNDVILNLNIGIREPTMED